MSGVFPLREVHVCKILTSKHLSGKLSLLFKIMRERKFCATCYHELFVKSGFNIFSTFLEENFKGRGRPRFLPPGKIGGV